MTIKDHGKKSYLRTIEVDGYNLQQVNDLMDAGKLESFDGFVNKAISEYLSRVNNFGTWDKMSKTEKNGKHEKYKKNEKYEKYNFDANERDIQIWKNEKEIQDEWSNLPNYRNYL